MKITCVGGGPSGLYFSLLMKKAFPDTELTVLERNRPDDTFGWGVVFSRETLGNLEEADPESYAEITRAFTYWDDIETHVRGQVVTSTGHGFCGLGRRELLHILHRRCQALGVKLEFGREVKDLSELPASDLVLASDGVHSPLREKHAAHFRPTLDWRKCKFSWLGTTLPMKAFTFFFKESPHGLFQVHAYPFEKERGTGTFIVECREEVWKKAGLDTATEADTLAFCESLFKDELRGHRLLANKSIWRTFPTISCEKWFHGNLCLIGDAAHTAHFSIGSGTKLAMEDAIALRDAFVKHGTKDVQRVLAAYEAERKPEVTRTQKAAQTSLEWFENSARYLGQDPVQFTFNLMTRSKRITYDNLKLRDPALVEATDQAFARGLFGGVVPAVQAGHVPPPVFQPFPLRGLLLENRIVVSPMCQYVAEEGMPGDWHLVHLGSRAIGGAGLVMTEMTDVTPEGRITHGCAGLYTDAQAQAWKRVVEFVHARSHSAIGVQLAHAGRKGSCSRPWEGDRPLRRDEGAWETLGPSAVPYGPGWHTPKEMTRPDMDRVRDAFVEATRRALWAGFDLIELHVAHGYLLSSFLSPLSNLRTDAYGGTLENRLRYPLEVFDAVRAVWPEEKPLAVRISASDWHPEGFDGDDAVAVSRAFREHGCDLVDVSTGGNVPESRPEYGRMYQVPFADRIRHEVQMPVMAVGAILGADHANTVVAAGRADLCALARAHLKDPYLTLHAAEHYGQFEQEWPAPYLLAKPRPSTRKE